MTISTRGKIEVVGHEGFVSKAYRDVTGTWTIGTGFTNGSTAAIKVLGPIRAGKTITQEQNDRVLDEVFRVEYGPPVDVAMPSAKQHELDAGYSYCFNCGPRSMNDSWLGLWRDGQKKEAGKRLEVTRVTSKGVWLQGLVNRRKKEAKLLVHGTYSFSRGPAKPSIPEPSPKTDPEFIAYMDKLKELGYTDVLAFQKKHPNLINDNILGKATKAQIDRDISAKSEGVGTGTGIVVGGGIAAILAQYGSTILALAVLGAFMALALWFFVRRREEVTHWIRNRFGKDDKDD